MTCSNQTSKQSNKPLQNVTLSDVAKVAGVSLITVSRALNKPELVSDKTLKRVMRVVEQLGYVPNLLAGNLKSNRSRLMVVLVPTIAGSPFLKSVQVFMDYVTEAGYQVMIGQTGYDNRQQEDLIDVTIGRRPDGVVVTGRVSSLAARRKLKLAGIPVVETWQISEQPVDMLVGFSHEKVGHSVADYLWERKYRRFAVITGDDERGQQRLDGFIDRINLLYRLTGGSKPKIETFDVKIPSSVGAGRNLLAHMINNNINVEAIISCSDSVAVGVLYEAQFRKINVPDSLAVIGYGDTEIAPYTVPSLTTVKIDSEEIGLLAAKMLIARAEGRTVLKPIVDIGFVIEERGTA